MPMILALAVDQVKEALSINDKNRAVKVLFDNSPLTLAEAAWFIRHHSDLSTDFVSCLRLCIEDFQSKHQPRM